MARVVAALAPHAKMLASHKYGNFALQRTIELCDPDEALRLATPILRDAWVVYEAGGGSSTHVKHRNPAAFVLQAAVCQVVRPVVLAMSYNCLAVVALSRQSLLCLGSRCSV